MSIGRNTESMHGASLQIHIITYTHKKFNIIFRRGHTSSKELDFLVSSFTVLDL